jgi:hypothetical protein
MKKISALMSEQHKAILERKLPDNLKLAIAKTIENNLFAKVFAKCPLAVLLTFDAKS